MDELPTFEKVKITCSSSNCEDDKHCYRPTRGQWKDDGVRGECQACGDTSVDMSVTRALDASDPEAIFAQLGREFIRDRFLNAPIDEKGRRELRKHGVDGLKARIAGHLRWKSPRYGKCVLCATSRSKRLHQIGHLATRVVKVQRNFGRKFRIALKS